MKVFLQWAVISAIFAMILIYYITLPVVEVSIITGKCVAVRDHTGVDSIYDCSNLPKIYVTLEVK